MRTNFFILLLFLFLIGCGQGTFITKRESIQTAIQQPKAHAHQQTIKAIKAIPKANEPSFKLFTYLNLGSGYFFHSEFDSTIFMLNKAEELIDDLYTRKVTQEVASVFLNQYSVNYIGFPIEHLMIHWIKSISFLAKENTDAALVEIRKLQLKLTWLEDNPSIFKFNKSDYQSLYYFNGLMQYLYGDKNSARVNFANAGFDADSIIAILSDEKDNKLFIQMSSIVPELQEAYFRLLVTSEKNVHNLKVAFPIVHRSYSEIPTNGIYSAKETIEVGRIFNHQVDTYLEDQLPKTFLRVATKFILTEAATAIADDQLSDIRKDKEKKKKEGKEVDDSSTSETIWTLVSFASNIFKVVNDITEKADLRHWFLLPNSIQYGFVSSKVSTEATLISENQRLTLVYLPGKKSNPFNPNKHQLTHTIDLTGKTNSSNKNDQLRNNSLD